jgi:hypothetical protein
LWQEKLDFLEEHVEQLLAELQKKNRIIQAYVLSIEPGALISEQSDLHKVRVKTIQHLLTHGMG